MADEGIEVRHAPPAARTPAGDATASRHTGQASGVPESESESAAPSSPEPPRRPGARTPPAPFVEVNCEPQPLRHSKTRSPSYSALSTPAPSAPAAAGHSR